MDHGHRKHAILSASSAERWIACPGSVALTRDLPDTTSAAAQWGTDCHELAEVVLRAEYDGFTEVTVEALADPKYDSEMHEAVSDYQDFIRSIIDEYDEDPLIWIEERLDFSTWVPHGFGTGDLVLVFIKAKRAYLIDLKGGKGIKVFAKDNAQLKLYGAGVLALLQNIAQIDELTLCIAQPRLDHFDQWSLTDKELITWLESITPIAVSALKGSSDLKAGEHCTFCRAKNTCPERTREALEAFEDNDVIPGLLPFETIAALLPKLDRIINWAKGVQAFAYAQVLNHGAKVPGYKLVAGRAARKWSDDKQVAECLTEAGFKDDDIWNKKILGIGDAEKLVGKKHKVFLLAQKAEGSPTLVPESDPRVEWHNEASTLAAFDD